MFSNHELDNIFPTKGYNTPKNIYKKYKTCEIKEPHFCKRIENRGRSILFKLIRSNQCNGFLFPFSKTKVPFKLNIIN